MAQSLGYPLLANTKADSVNKSESPTIKTLKDKGDGNRDPDK